MSKVVLLKIGDGDFKTGFSVNLRIQETGKVPFERDGRLDPAPNIQHLYQDWRNVYVHRRMLHYRRKEICRGNDTYRALTKIKGGTTRFSIKDSGQELALSLDRWLGENNAGFRPIREALLDRLNQTDSIRFSISPREGILWQLPWHLCELFQRYPHSDVTLGSPDNPLATVAESTRSRLKILVLLGQAEELDVKADLQLLRDRLPEEAELAEPLIATNRETLNEAFWKHDIDILFFAGHSTSQGSEGRFFLNETDSITIAELKYALQQAIDRGLKLAIFNSCDGVKLAQELAEIKMPAIVVMREPVPDEAAQRFLEYFLEAFARDKEPLYKAVRKARERLHGLEEEYPCASWLPVLYQHPAADELTWTGMLRSPSLEAIEIAPSLKIPRFRYLVASTAASLVLLGGLVSAAPISNYINNKRSDSLNKQGSICFNQKKVECARKNFDQALALNPNNANALNNMGLLYDSWHEYDRAREYFQKAKIQGNPGGCSNEARLDIIEGKYDKAESLLQFCLLQVNYPIAKYFILKNLGWALFELEKYNEAEKYLQEAIEINRDKGSANCVLAMTLDVGENSPEALIEWRYCLINARDDIDEERGWKRIARKRIQQLEGQKQ